MEIADQKVKKETQYNDQGIPILFQDDLIAPGRTGHLKIDLARDSYIISTCGPRGSGKNILMTYLSAHHMAVKNMRVLSNFLIKFEYHDKHGRVRICESEPLDLYKLLCFDGDYKNCIIVMDEAPTIVSQMSSQSWKNRLLNMFLQQVRKNQNSLIYAAQNPGWVDFGLRWQTDLRFNCRDASKRYSDNPTAERGEVVLLDMSDQSGNFSGYTFEERPRIWKFKLEKCYKLWPCYNTMQIQDPFESLQKVDLKLSRYEVDGRSDDDKARANDRSHIDGAKEYVKATLDNNSQRIISRDLYPEHLTASQKLQIGKYMTSIGATRHVKGNGDRYYDITNVDRDML